MFETGAELGELQRLLDKSFGRSGELLNAVHGPGSRLSAPQLAGFRGVRLVAIATVNSKGEPRVSPRSAAFLHGRFYLAVSSKSVTVRRLLANSSMGLAYYENHLLVLGHGTAALLPGGTQSFDDVRSEWEKAFRGGRDALRGIDAFLRVDAVHLVAYARRPDSYPKAWGRR